MRSIGKKVRSSIRWHAMIFMALLVTACASPTVVQEKQVGDTNLSCTQLAAAIDEARDFEKRARDERKATGTNVAAALFFWPGLIATYSNTEDAIKAAKDRQSHLAKIYQDKNCDRQIGGAAGSTQIEQRLLELKALRDKGVLSDAEYEAARKKALGL